MMKEPENYSAEGYCPICEQGTVFNSNSYWYRDHLFCQRCGSIPRERAIAKVLEDHLSGWRDLSIHESSPTERGLTSKLRQECPQFMATQFHPDKEPGDIVGHYRNENLELQTFEDDVFDLVISQDVMEHVNRPDLCFKEIARTLKKGGAYLFTVPTYKELVSSVRRAYILEDGSEEHLAEPEYHGNPVSDKGALVTFHYGYDLPEKIYEWSAMDTQVFRYHSHQLGIIGEFTEVYLCHLP
ncbi:MAG: class I SAM-dependent methyltransferase [Arenicella sp.]